MDDLVSRAALHEPSTEWRCHRAEGILRHLLTVVGASGSRDVLVHKGASEVVASSSKQLSGTRDTDLHPTHLNIVDQAVVHDASDGMHEDRLAEGGPSSRLLLEIDG